MHSLCTYQLHPTSEERPVTVVIRCLCDIVSFRF